MLDKQKAATLNTTATKSLIELEQVILSSCKIIEAWFEAQWNDTAPPVYGSVDLRNAGFKLAPIDMNLFPAGFNNLNPDYLSFSVDAARDVVSRLRADARNILIVPESHTRNMFYWSNVRTLMNILQQAGFNTRLGFLSDELVAARDLELPDGGSVTIEPLQRDGGNLKVDGFSPDLVLLNNDLSDGIPDILQNVSQLMIPPAKLGWSHRLKSGHFQYYDEVAQEFARVVNIDPWLIAPRFRFCGQIDFMQQDGMDCVVMNAEKLFEELHDKYIEYNIPHEPFLVLKSDAGTYGMAVMTVRSPEELKNMNRKQRTRMSKSKGSQPVNRVIIQEGVYTFERVSQGAVAEPVVYLWGRKVVGGFYRVHKDRSIDESLNAPGMSFEPIPFAKPCNEPCADLHPDACQNRFYTYGVVARLSMLAAAREIRDQVK